MIKKLHFPDKGFHEFFSSVSRVKPESEIAHRDAENEQRISKHLSITRTSMSGRLWAAPEPWLIEWIDVEMIKVRNDTISFELVERDNGHVLLIAAHSSIIGSRWLTLLPSIRPVEMEVTG